jgi:8-amino-7-oxononanoate synthase
VFHVTQARPGPLAELEQELRDLERRGLRRYSEPPQAPLPADAISFCSNDYLGLASVAAPPAPSGAGSSRLVAGDKLEHRHLEADLAEWLGSPAALVFSSGYAANVGTIPALARPGDLLVSDALNHASIVDGARLSRARIEVVPHLDLDAVEHALLRRAERRAWVLVESYYSMDADGPDLRALREICDRLGAGLLVDEAHALGVLGPDGRGRLAEAGVTADVLVGTLGKALGSQGAFVAGSPVVREWLWNRARSFVFSTGLAPVVAEASRRALEVLRNRPHLRADALARARVLREGLSGLDVRGFGHIVPIVIGESDRTVRVAARLRERGVHVAPIRPPTVPEGTSRLRVTVTARHTDDDVCQAVAAIRSAWDA